MSALLQIDPLSLVVVPILLAAAIAFTGRVRFLGPTIALSGPLLSVAFALAVLGDVAAGPDGSVAAPFRSAAAGVGAQRVWFGVGDWSLRVATAVDSLAALMLLVVGLVAACVIVFSVGYLHGDPGWARYFAVLSLFVGSMNLLVIASSFTALFIGWELVGACSFLLIGFWFQKPTAAAAATKAFLTTRVGDVGLLLGIAILWSATGGSDVYEIALLPLDTLPPALVNAAAVCLAIGAMGKSAQFPLHAWLPDAMEGPTPVSALIHAATMVAAGVYLVVRLWPVFDAAPAAQALLLTVGVVSALGAGLVACVQRDIKKVLAYSTISQIGFMFAALGAGAWLAAFFHLMVHAGFKSLLFLGSGSVIHGTGEQDIHKMGGLRGAMPLTFATWAVGALALAGVAPLSGFFSKDAVLEAVWHASPLAGAGLFAASAITAFYAARVTRLVFFGTPAGSAHGHEGPASMSVPLVVLAVPAALLGLAHGPVAQVLGEHGEPLALGISAAALTLAAVGGVAGWISSAGVSGDVATRARLGAAGDLLEAAYRYDAAVDRAVVRPTVAASRSLWAVGDRLLADGIASGASWLGGVASRGLVRVYRGDVQAYAIVIVAGVALMLAAASWVGR